MLSNLKLNRIQNMHIIWIILVSIEYIYKKEREEHKTAGVHQILYSLSIPALRNTNLN